MSFRTKTTDGKQKTAKKKAGIGDKQIFTGRMTKFDPAMLPKIKEMYKNGAFAINICAELGICRDTMRRWCLKDGEHCHPEFARVVSIGNIASECYWFNQMERMDAKNWQFIMKAKFGWSTKVNQYKDSSALQLNYNPDKPSETMDRIIQAVVRDEISPEKAKLLTDTIINSYNVRCIENT